MRGGSLPGGDPVAGFGSQYVVRGRAVKPRPRPDLGLREACDGPVRPDAEHDGAGDPIIIPSANELPPVSSLLGWDGEQAPCPLD